MKTVILFPILLFWLILILLPGPDAFSQCETYINIKKDRQTRVTHIKSKSMALNAAGYEIDLHIYWHHSHHLIRTKVEKDGHGVEIGAGGGYIFQFADGEEVFVANTNEKGDDHPNNHGKLIGQLAFKNHEREWIEKPKGIIEKLSSKELSAIKFRAVDGYDFDVALSGDYNNFFQKTFNCIEQYR
jgi:hypothetical protein